MYGSLYMSSRIQDHQHDCETCHHTIKTSLRRVLANHLLLFTWEITAAPLPRTKALQGWPMEPRALTAESALHTFGQFARLSISNKAVGTPSTIWSVDRRQSENQLACLFPCDCPGMSEIHVITQKGMFNTILF